VQAGGRLVIAIDGKTVRGAKNKDGKAPHLVAALAHGIGTVLGQVALGPQPAADTQATSSCMNTTCRVPVVWTDGAITSVLMTRRCRTSRGG